LQEDVSQPAVPSGQRDDVQGAAAQGDAVHAGEEPYDSSVPSAATEPSSAPSLDERHSTKHDLGKQSSLSEESQSAPKEAPTMSAAEVVESGAEVDAIMSADAASLQEEEEEKQGQRSSGGGDADGGNSAIGDAPTSNGLPEGAAAVIEPEKKKDQGRENQQPNSGGDRRSRSGSLREQSPRVQRKRRRERTPAPTSPNKRHCIGCRCRLKQGIADPQSWTPADHIRAMEVTNNTVTEATELVRLAYVAATAATTAAAAHTAAAAAAAATPDTTPDTTSTPLPRSSSGRRAAGNRESPTDSRQEDTASEQDQEEVRSCSRVLA
jgi:hypothetical protein